jgi:tRNA G18 (ribose-2'-O)-methylase SpoU
LLASNYRVESLLVAEGQVARLGVPDPVTVYCAPRSLIEAVAGFRFHRGVLGCGLRPAPRDLAVAVPPTTAAATIVVCSAIRDPENLGGILRNCAAFGVDLVVIGNHSADPFSRRVIRVSMAAVLKLNLFTSTQLEADVRRLRDQYAVHLAATVLDPQAGDVKTAHRPHRLGLMLGNEMDGLDASLVALSHSRWTIPMRLQTDSLNVAVASGIFLYHFSHLCDGRELARPSSMLGMGLVQGETG